LPAHDQENDSSSRQRRPAWLDAGTHESLLESSQFVHALQARQGMMISCPEEIAYRMNYIDAAQVRTIAAELMKGNDYGQYLLRLIAAEESDLPFHGLG
jgi:glucose-1-phosphate thymidylyltransferase